MNSIHIPTTEERSDDHDALGENSMHLSVSARKMGMTLGLVCEQCASGPSMARSCTGSGAT
jgi:hypothetical protein